MMAVMPLRVHSAKRALCGSLPHVFAYALSGQHDCLCLMDDPQSESSPMALPMRTRKILGTFILLAFIIIYAFAIMLIGVGVLNDAPTWLELTYYLVSGCAWAFPAMLILKWMLKPDEAQR